MNFVKSSPKLNLVFSDVANVNINYGEGIGGRGNAGVIKHMEIGKPGTANYCDYLMRSRPPC